MAINLLPSEEKTKADKAKSTPQKVIAMTGPSRHEKKRSNVKRGGVLTFFKSAFRKPSESVTPEMQLPEDKVRVEEHILHQRPQPSQQKPKITYQAPLVAPKPAPATHAAPLSHDRGGFIARIFRTERPTPEAEPAELPKAPLEHADDRFPKYVRTEKIGELTAKPKQRNGDVIKVMTPAPPPPAERTAAQSGDHQSVWTRIATWFRSLFGPAAPQQQPLKPIETPPTPEAKATKPSVEFTTKVERSPDVRHTPQPVAPAVPPQPVAKPIMPPVKPITVTPSSLPPTPAPQPVVPPPPPPPAKKQAAVVPPAKMPASHGGADKKVPPPPPPAPPTSHGSFWDRIRGMFSKKSAPAKAGLGSAADGSFAGQIGMNWEVNLVPEEALEQEISISRVLGLATVAIIAAGLVFGGWLWANWYYNTITTNIDKINNDIAIADIQIRSYKDLQDNVAALQDEITDVRTLLDKHVYWSAVFTQLERYTSPEVYYTTMTADVNGSITLKAVGKDYDAAIKQLMVLNAATGFVSSVTVSDIAFAHANTTAETATTQPTVTATDETVGFSITMTVNPDIFYYPGSL